VRGVQTAVLALLVACASALPAAAADPLRGTVKRSFTATGVNGRVTSTFPATAAHIYASFIWLHAPTAGQKLEIDWFGPSGERVAVWRNRTLKTDTAGTRLYSFISRKAIETRPGHWRVELSVGGVERAQQTFTVSKKMKKKRP
jgi:hypothetical protein